MTGEALACCCSLLAKQDGRACWATSDQGALNAWTCVALGVAGALQQAKGLLPCTNLIDSQLPAVRVGEADGLDLHGITTTEKTVNAAMK